MGFYSCVGDLNLYAITVLQLLLLWLWCRVSTSLVVNPRSTSWATQLCSGVTWWPCSPTSALPSATPSRPDEAMYCTLHLQVTFARASCLICILLLPKLCSEVRMHLFLFCCCFACSCLHLCFAWRLLACFIANVSVVCEVGIVGII